MDELLKTLRDEYPGHVITVSLLLNGGVEIKAFEKDAKSIKVGLGTTVQEAVDNLREKPVI